MGHLLVPSPAGTGTFQAHNYALPRISRVRAKTDIQMFGKTSLVDLAFAFASVKHYDAGGANSWSGPGWDRQRGAVAMQSWTTGLYQ